MRHSTWIAGPILFQLQCFLDILLVNGFPIGVQMLLVEMMERWKIRLSDGAKREVGEVPLENGIIQGDAFFSIFFVLMIDPLIKILKRVGGDDVRVLYNMDDLKASMTDIQTAEKSTGS